MFYKIFLRSYSPAPQKITRGSSKSHHQSTGNLYTQTLDRSTRGSKSHHQSTGNIYSQYNRYIYIVKFTSLKYLQAPMFFMNFKHYVTSVSNSHSEGNILIESLHVRSSDSPSISSNSMIFVYCVTHVGIYLYK